MLEPTNLMRKQAARLFADCEEEQGRFLDSLLSSKGERQPAVIWTRPELKGVNDLELLTDGVPDWLPDSVSFVSPKLSPGKSVLFEKGGIYPVDTSSIFTASAMLATTRVTRVLDVCAAPGGKSLFASTSLKPEILVSNEVIGKRLGILRHNLKKTGRPHLFTQSLDPAELAEVGKSLFDLVIVDAPCSGQSLLAKGIDNPGCFHPNIIKGNAKRQIRILGQSSECVSPGGYLFYSSCTFARPENEGAIEKFMKRTEGFTPIEVPHLQPFQSDLCDFYCYRIYPHRQNGAGGFVCLMKKDGEPGELGELPETLVSYPVIS